MDFYPYNISHLHLEKNPPGFLPGSDQGRYMVFWWKNIPLGQLFLPAGKAIDEDQFRKMVLNAIDPAMEYYSAGKTSLVNFRDSFLKGYQPAFSGIMQAIFDPYTNIIYPAKLDVSLIICTRNRPDHLRQCLNTLEKLYTAPKEIIIIDNAPTNNETELLAGEYRNVIYFREPRPGLDIARNAGIKKSTARVVAFIDDDIVAEPTLVYEINEAFRDTDTAAMTGLILAAELKTSAQLLFEQQWSFNRGFTGRMYSRDFFERTLSSGPPVWEIGAGANMAFRKSVLDETGYFDERLDAGAAGCNGDSEIWFRILNLGYAIVYNPRAVVHHEHRKEFSGLQAQLFNYMRGFTVAALIQQKHKPGIGYHRHLFRVLPRWYLMELIKGFPRYEGRYRTVFSEIRGMLSGLIYFQLNKNKPSFTNDKTDAGR